MSKHAVGTVEQDRALATAAAIEVLRTAGAHSAHVQPVWTMTRNARDRFDAELAAYFERGGVTR